MQQTYNWKRYWCKTDGAIRKDDDGFLIEPEEKSIFFQNDAVTFNKIKHLHCLLLLGEPGIGKSIELLRLYDQKKAEINNDQMLYAKLGDYSNEDRLCKEIFEDSNLLKCKDSNSVFYLFLDSIDEGKINIDNINKLLTNFTEKNKWDNLYLLLTCRTAANYEYLKENLSAMYGEDFGVYELQPLCLADVELTLKERNIEKEIFLEVLRKNDIKSFAAQPITLQFLINSFKSGTFPHNRTELYKKGIQQLIAEPNLSRKDSLKVSRYPIPSKYNIIKRIAASMMLGNKSMILKDNDSEGESIDLYLPSLYRAQEDINLFINILDAGIFVSHGDEKMGWAHKTFPEFLTAEYICNFDEEQIKSIFLSPLDNKTVPQLQEVASWLIALRPSFKMLFIEKDPQLLLRSSVELTDNEKEEILLKLLDLYNKEEFYDNSYATLKYYARLKSPTLIKNIQDYLDKDDLNRLAKREIFSIIAECDLKEFLPKLFEIFADTKEELNIREYAGHRLSRIINDEYKTKIREVLFAGLEEDVRDGIKGICLKNLWPNYITAKELFSVLTSKKEDHYGSEYDYFLHGNPTLHLQVEDIPVALKWAIKNCSNSSFGDRQSFETIIMSIVSMGWENLEVPEIRDSFLELVLHVLDEYTSIKNKISVKIAELLRPNSEKRRIFISLLINSVKIENIYLLRLERNNEDFTWALTQVQLSHERDFKLKWLRYARRHFDMDNKSQIYELLEFATNEPLTKNEFEFLTPVELDSELAKKQKKFFKYETNTNTKKRPLLKLECKERIIKDLAILRQGDITPYWRMQYNIILGDGVHQDQCYDIEKMSIWKEMNEDDRYLIVNNTFSFLEKTDPNYREWQDKYIYYIGAAGYRGLLLLFQRDKNYYLSIGKQVLEKWAEALFHYSILEFYNEYEFSKDLIEKLYHDFEAKIIPVFQKRINKEQNVSGSYLRHLELLELYKYSTFNDIIFKSLQSENINDDFYITAVDYLLKANYEPISEYLYSTIADDVMLPPKRSIAIHKLLELNAKVFWPLVYTKILINDELAKEFLYRISRHYNNYFLDKLTEEELSNLYSIVIRLFPISEDPDEKGVHTVTPRHEVRFFRDKILEEISGRGTYEALSVAKKIIEEHPEAFSSKYFLFNTKNKTREKMWKPLNPQNIIEMYENKDKLVISNEKDLINILLKFLKQFEKEIHSVSSPVSLLWENDYTIPKAEGDLSNFITWYLRCALKDLIINREVEIRPKMGDVKGERTDLLVEVKNENQETIGAIIEVKGCWNSGLLTSMENQLKDRYLKDNTEHKCGIYLVGWFLCENWDNTDSRKKSTPKMTIDELKTNLQKQAEELSEPGKIIQSFVLNCVP